MQPLFIGPQEIGLQRNLKPFMIPDQAYPSLSDCFVYRGRVRKKPGFTLRGRLQRNLTNQVEENTASATYEINLLDNFVANEPNASIVPNTVVLTFNPGGSQTVIADNGLGVFVKVSGPLNLDGGQPNFIEYNTGSLEISFTTNPGSVAVSANFSYYPSLPVMGILQRELGSINNRQQITFDTRYAYQYTNGEFSELPSTYTTTWSGSDYQLFWGTSYGYDSSNNSLFWVTNNNPAIGFAVTAVAGSVAGPPSTANITSAGNNFVVGDTVTFLGMSAGVADNQVGTVTAAGSPFSVTNPGTNVFTNASPVTGYAVALTSNGIKYYNGTTWNLAVPRIDSTNFMTGCLMILPYKNRLLAFCPFEGTPTNSTQNNTRIRWSGIGLETDFENGWRSDIIGKGGFADAPTNQNLVSAGFVKDDLVVYFSSSTYRLVYTGNEIEPFVFQKINTELGADSTFSPVPFDNGLLVFGNVGVHTSNSVTVERIDQIIPDEIFNLSKSNNGIQRVCGIRDFFLEVAYFTYPELPSDESGQTYLGKFPNKILLYNYRNNTWAFFNESFTCFGYFLNPQNETWSDLSYLTWSQWTDPWYQGIATLDFLNVAAGNQQGFVVTIDPNDIENSATRYIQSMSANTITSPAHNLYLNNYILIENCIGSTNLNGTIQEVIGVTTDTITIPTAAVGTYLGNGDIRLLSNIKISSKMFTPFWTFGRRYRLKYAEYLFDNTASGQVTCNVFVDTKDSDSTNDPNNPNNTDFGATESCLLGNNVIFTQPETLYATQQLAQDVIWHRQYYSTEGETFQIQITLSDEQMQNLNIVNSDIVLHAIIFHFEVAGTFQ